MDWTEKHRPETLDEVRGNDYAVSQLRDWAASWGDSHTNAIILYGPPGIGKTTAAHAVANDAGWDAIEMNASEHRTKDIVDKVAGSAANMGTLTGGTSGRRLVILDEADNFHGTVDRGGAKAIRDIVDNAAQPVVLIANDYYDGISKSLREACDGAEFEYPDMPVIARFLRDISDDEGYDYDVDALKLIASRADGDIRAAVNDLQTAATHATDNTITKNDVPESARDQTETIFPFLDTVLQDGSPEEAVTAAYQIDEIPEDLMQWVEENVVSEYNTSELVDAYHHLVEADVWLGRVRATQDYSYWRYVTEHTTAGVAESRGPGHNGFTKWSPPSTWSKLGSTRGKRAQRDSISQRIAETSNVSMDTARDVVLPYLRLLTHHCKNRATTVAMTGAYGLDESDVAFITGSGEDTQKVGDIVTEATASESDGTETTRKEKETDNDGDGFTNMGLDDVLETASDDTPDSSDDDDESDTQTSSSENDDEDDDDDSFEQATLF